MMSKTVSYLLITLSLVTVLGLVFVSGCTGNAAPQITVKEESTATPTVIITESPKIVTESPTAAPTVVPTVVSNERQSIKISGSTTVLPIVQKAADQYMATHPNADIQVSGGGSGVGIQAIGLKTVDIGMTSREVTKVEMVKYPGFVITTVAQDGIAVVVNKMNEIQFITMDQVKDIYLGKTIKWSQITGANVPNTNNQIVIIGRDSASGTRAYFDEFVLLKSTPTKNMLEKNSNGAVLQTVSQTPGSIGYISIGFVNDEVKSLPVWYNYDKIISPTIDNVKSKKYPISRDLYVVTNGQPSGLTKDFIDYIISPDGQKIVAEEGYVTLN